MKLGYVDAGGGMRGVYAAGVLDTCMEQNVTFDSCIGISAGSANVISYLAGQQGRNYQFYHEYSSRKEYMGPGQFFRTGSFINFNYIYGTLSNSDGESPLDYQKVMKNPADFTVIAEEAETGGVKLFTKDDLAQDDYRILMASSCVPGVDKPVMLDGVPYYDGALADPVPIKRAFAAGCDRVVLILTKPLDVLRKQGKDVVLARMIQKKYPKSAENMRSRAERYNNEVSLAKEYAKQGKVLIVAPSDTCGVDTLNRKPEALAQLYEKGREDGRAIGTWLEQQRKLCN